MMLNVDIPDDILQWFSDLVGPDCSPLVADMLESVLHRIEELRWVYFPLSDEYPLSMFITHSSFSKMVDSLESLAVGSDIPCCRLFTKDGRLRWNPPEELSVLLTGRPKG